MSISFLSVSVTNNLGVRIALILNGRLKASLGPGEVQILSTKFDQVGLYNPSLSPVIHNQNPAATLIVTPGNIGFFEAVPGGVDFRYAPPNGVQNPIHFT